MTTLDRLRSLYATRLVAPIAGRHAHACLTCRASAVMGRDDLRAVKQMHRLKNGLTTDIFNALSVHHDHAESAVLDRVNRVAGAEVSDATRVAVGSLRERGFYVFPDPLAPDIVCDLRAFSLREPA